MSAQYRLHSSPSYTLQSVLQIISVESRSACAHDRAADVLRTLCIPYAEKDHGILLQGFSEVPHTELSDGISVSTQYGTCIPFRMAETLYVVHESSFLVTLSGPRRSEASLFFWNRQTFVVPSKKPEVYLRKITCHNYHVLLLPHPSLIV